MSGTSTSKDALGAQESKTVLFFTPEVASYFIGEKIIRFCSFCFSDSGALSNSWGMRGSRLADSRQSFREAKNHPVCYDIDLKACIFLNSFYPDKFSPVEPTHSIEECGEAWQECGKKRVSKVS